MAWTLYNGFATSSGNIPYPWAIIVNFLLLIQFPLGHSFLLSKRGYFILKLLAPKMYWKKLSTTTYVTIASIQLIILFYFWSPSEVVVYELNWPFNILNIFGFVCSWILLSISSLQAGYKVQTGSLGWTSVFKGVAPKFPPMPQTGVFSIMRQPIYLSFCLVLWTPPLMSLDLIIVATTYSLYCYIAPKFKELRFAKHYGSEFLSYQKNVPYFLPRLRKKIKPGNN